MLEYIGLIVAMLLWGATYIWSKEVFLYYNPLETIFIRVVLSTFFLFAWRRLFSQAQVVLPGDRAMVMLLSFLQPFLYFVGENYGLFYASATVAAVFIGTIPIFSMLLGRIIFRQSLGIWGVLGATICFIGVILVIFSDAWSVALKPLGGLGLLLAILSGSFYGILVIRLGHRYSALTLVYYQNRNALLFFTPLILLASPELFGKIPPSRIAGNLVALALFGSIIAFVLFTRGIARLGMGKAYSFSNLIPVFTAFFAFLFLAEKPKWYNMLGIALVVCGLFLVNRKQNQPASSSASC